MNNIFIDFYFLHKFSYFHKISYFSYFHNFHKFHKFHNILVLHPNPAISLFPFVVSPSDHFEHIQTFRASEHFEHPEHSNIRTLHAAQGTGLRSRAFRKRRAVRRIAQVRGAEYSNVRNARMSDCQI